jgi:Respiratory-chain NADH dehydrogenase, 30 Kd subunit
MDAAAFLARVEGYHKDGWRLALINVTTVMPVVAAHGAAAAAPAAPAESAEAAASPAPADAPGVFEIAWAFARDGKFETIREQIVAGDAVPSVSEFFGAAFLYENEIRELFGINVVGIAVDLKGQLYQTATKVPFSHAAIKARLAAVAAAAVKPS